jgi:hypothetical protein
VVTVFKESFAVDQEVPVQRELLEKTLFNNLFTFHCRGGSGVRLTDHKVASENKSETKEEQLKKDDYN